MTLQVYHGLLSFTVHTKPKVRLPGRQNMGMDLPLQEAGAAGLARLSRKGSLPGVLGSCPKVLFLPSEAPSAWLQKARAARPTGESFPVRPPESVLPYWLVTC